MSVSTLRHEEAPEEVIKVMNSVSALHDLFKKMFTTATLDNFIHAVGLSVQPLVRSYNYRLPAAFHEKTASVSDRSRQISELGLDMYMYEYVLGIDTAVSRAAQFFYEVIQQHGGRVGDHPAAPKRVESKIYDVKNVGRFGGALVNRPPSFRELPPLDNAPPKTLTAKDAANMRCECATRAGTQCKFGKKFGHRCTTHHKMGARAYKYIAPAVEDEEDEDYVAPSVNHSAAVPAPPSPSHSGMSGTSNSLSEQVQQAIQDNLPCGVRTAAGHLCSRTVGNCPYASHRAQRAAAANGEE